MTTKFIIHLPSASSYWAGPKVRWVRAQGNAKRYDTYAAADKIRIKTPVMRYSGRIVEVAA